MTKTQRQTPTEFFYEWAGYSYDPKTQTPEEGRQECAEKLAAAEQQARELGYSFEWSIDPDLDSSEFSKKRPFYQLWQCLCRDETGSPSASLCGIDFGRDKEPWGEPYRRVVEAELACDALASREDK